MRILLAAAAIVAAAAVVALPFRVLRIAAPAAVFLYLLAASLAIIGPLREYARGFREGVRVGNDPEWIDHAVPRNARVDVITTGAQNPTLLTLRLRLMHFWNRRVTVVHELFPLVMCCVAQAPAQINTATRRILLAGTAPPPQYVVVIPPIALEESVLVRHQRAVLYRVEKPLRVPQAVASGPSDGR